MINEREKLIGARLRAFRETLQIPRSKFAVTIGFGSERIASYESGRAPLLFEVFVAVFNKYLISPQWLATGEGSPKWPEVYKSIMSRANYCPRDSFSVIYNKQFARDLDKMRIEAGSDFEKIQRVLDRFNRLMEQSGPGSVSKETHKRLSKMAVLVKNLRKQMCDDLQWRQKVKTQLVQNQDLTNPTTSVKHLEVKPQLPNLLQRLNRATEQTGKMSALADFLKVPLASVSRWLSGKREPGGEITLKLLRWVEQQERQK